MKKLHFGLAGALLAQIAIAALLFWQRPAAGPAPAEPLLTFAGEQVDRIELYDDEQNKTVLVREGEGWKLPEYHQLAARPRAVEQLLEKLEGIRLRLPVARSESAQSRFEVAEEKFQRKLVLRQGDKVLETLYLGTSPGYRQIHLRRDGEDETYAVALNAWDLPAEPERWFDNGLLKMESVARIEGDGFSLRREGDQWQAGEGYAVVQEELDKLLDTLRSLTVEAAEPAGGEIPEGAARLKLASGSGERVLRIYQDGERYWVQPEGDALRYRIPEYRFKALSGARAEALVRAVKAGEEAQEAISRGDKAPASGAALSS